MNIYLGNLVRSITEDQIKEFVSEYGEITSVKIIMDRETGQPRGFAFIEMSNQDEAKNFIAQCNGMEFEGRRLVVSEARKREDNGGGNRGPRRGGSFGGRREGGNRNFRNSGSRFNNRYE